MANQKKNDTRFLIWKMLLDITLRPCHMRNNSREKPILSLPDEQQKPLFSLIIATTKAESTCPSSSIAIYYKSLTIFI